jgi:hypothetical protein
MKKTILSSLFILFAVISLNAQQVKIVFTQPEVVLEPVNWDGKTTLKLQGTYAFRNLGKVAVNITDKNFELPCKCSKIIIPQSKITTEQKDFYVTYLYTIDMDDKTQRGSSETEIQQLRRDNGKFSKVITFFVEGDDEVHELYFDGQINFTN